ncbi:antitoxin [Pseudomonas aeruginosa]|uniref:type II toxin-antitoxin system RelB family antitoxin n=1 Tax=Pseudomonas aeruginosa TaxID=287 RepID=UPI0029BFD8CC|nr:antitoxin [Pseudomonas aeruginosa]
MTQCEQHDAYSRWLAAEIQAAIDDPRPSIPHEEVMAELNATIAGLKVRGKPENAAKTP